MNTGIIIFMVCWVALTIGLPFYFRKRGVQEGQMLATGFGILGTFIGIVVGLINFDTTNITQSVPEILNGLRFAFVTSIAGMGFSLIIGVFSEQLGFKSVELKDKSEKELLEEVLKEMKKMNNNIAGDNETTLITQIQKLRTVTVDKQDELKKAFDEFAKQMAENNTKALIEAVGQVMKDFNAKINDQLGENFKRLSEGVENLVVWQDKYKEQISDSADALKETRKATLVSTEALKEIIEQAKEFGRISEELGKSLEIMGSSITGIKSLADTLQDSGKEIRDEMEEITKRSIEALGQNLAGISEKLVSDYSQLQSAINSIVNNKN